MKNTKKPIKDIKPMPKDEAVVPDIKDPKPKEPPKVDPTESFV